MLFQRIARQAGIKPPALFDVTEKGQAAWLAYCRQVWSLFPGWGYDRGYVTEVARGFLPLLFAQIKLGRFLGYIDPEWRRVVGSRSNLNLAVIPLVPMGGRWMIWRLSRDADAPLLAFDEWAHAWRCPDYTRRGVDLTDLGAWRWGISESKAAHRIARICGVGRPVP